MTQVNVRNCISCFFNTHLKQDGTLVQSGPHAGQYSTICPLSQAMVYTSEVSAPDGS